VIEWKGKVEWQQPNLCWWSQLETSTGFFFSWFKICGPILHHLRFPTETMIAEWKQPPNISFGRTMCGLHVLASPPKPQFEYFMALTQVIQCLKAHLSEKELGEHDFIMASMEAAATDALAFARCWLGSGVLIEGQVKRPLLPRENVVPKGWKNMCSSSRYGFSWSNMVWI